MIKLLLLSVSLLSFVSLADNQVLIENVTVVSSHMQTPETQMNVLLSDGRIAKITNKKIESYDIKVNGTGKFLTPGLMDSHVHVSSIPGMGFGVEPVAVQHPTISEAYYEQQPRSFLYYGVTQVVDPNPGVNFNFFTSALLHPDYFRCEVLTSKNTFPYVEKTDDLSRSMFTYLIDENAQDTAENSVESLIRKIADSGALCIKIYFEDGYGDASQWPMLSTETLKRIKSSAEKNNLLLVAHANALDMQQLALSAGVDVIAHGLWNWGQYNREQNIPPEIANTLDKLINDDVGYMPTQRVIAGLGEVMLPTIVNSPEFLAITPKSLIDWYSTNDAQWFKKELRIGFDGMPDQLISDVFLYGRIGKGNKVIQYLTRYDHAILLASDFPGSPSYANQPGLTTYQEMKAMVTAGLSLKEVLAAATINNAAQFRIDKDYGTVEVGKIANLLLLEENPLESIEAWNSIETIFLHGTPIPRESLVVID